MSEQRQPPPVTVSAPGRADLLAAGPEPQGSGRRGPSRRVLIGLLVLGLAVVAVVNVRDHREQVRRAAAAELRRDALALSVRLSESGSQQGGSVHSWTVNLIVDAGDKEFTVLSARLDRPGWMPPVLENRSQKSHDLVFSLSESCRDVASAVSPAALLLRVQVKAGKVLMRRLDVDGQELLSGPRRDCGLAGVAESLTSSVTAARRSGDAVLLDLLVSNGSVEPATLTSVGVADARVMVAPRLPLPLAPFLDGAPAKERLVHLVVRFDRCPIAAPGQQLQLDLTYGVRDVAGHDLHPGLSDDRSVRLLTRLVADRCR